MKKLPFLCACVALLLWNAPRPAFGGTILDNNSAHPELPEWKLLPADAFKADGDKLVITAASPDQKAYAVVTANLKNALDGLDFSKNTVSIKMTGLAFTGSAPPAFQVYILSLYSGLPTAQGNAALKFRLTGSGTLGIYLGNPDGSNLRVWDTTVKLPLKSATLQIDPAGAKVTLDGPDGVKVQEVSWPDPVVGWRSATPYLGMEIHRNPSVGDAILTLTDFSVDSGPTTATAGSSKAPHAVGTPSSKNPGPIAMPAGLSQPVVIRPELIGHHPRVIFDAAGLEALKKKVADPRMAEIRQYFLAQVDYTATQPAPPYPAGNEDATRTIGDSLPSLAFAYLITGDVKYLDALRKWVTAVAAYRNWAGDEDLGASHLTFGMALAYDWVYDKWTPDERAMLEKALTLHGRLLFHRGALPPQNTWFWGGAYFQNHNWINNTGACAAALAVYDTAPKEMQSYIDYVRAVMEIPYLHLGVDGSNHEGPAYAFYGTNWLMFYFDMLKTADGEDLYDMPYMKGVGRYLIYNILPDAQNLVNYGDCPEKGWGSLDPAVFYKLAAQYHDGHMEWLRKRNETVFAPDSPQYPRRHGYFGSPFCLIWADPDVVAKPPDDLPLTGVFADAGLVISRSSWANDGSLVSLLCGPPGGLHLMKIFKTLPHAYAAFSHSHPDANAFLFYTGGKWTVSNPAGYTHDKQTHNENVWTADGKGQRGTDEWFDASTYLGDIPQPHLVRVADSPEAAYLVGEAAPAYVPAADLTQFRRHILFVKGAHPYIAIYDQVAASRPEVLTSYFHAFDNFNIPDPTHFSIGATPYAFGALFGPAANEQNPTPLMVASHPSRVIAQEGFQLAVAPPAPVESTWLISVIGSEDTPSKLLSAPAPTKQTGSAAPSITVGADKIVFGENDEVTLNGKPIAGNLLPATP